MHVQFISNTLKRGVNSIDAFPIKVELWCERKGGEVAAEIGLPRIVTKYAAAAAAAAVVVNNNLSNMV